MRLTTHASTVTAVCVALLMMMSPAEGRATPTKSGHDHHPSRTHKKSAEGAASTVPLHLDLNVLAPPPHFRPLENASISPWTYNVSQDASLFPPVVSEARCLLRGCLNAAGVEDRSLESRPVLHQVLMLRRVRSEGAAAAAAATGGGNSYHYRLESRLLAVGCTCVRPKVRQQV